MSGTVSDTNMEILSRSADKVTIQISDVDHALVVNALTELLKADNELAFYAQTGFTQQEARDLLASLNK